MGITFAFCKPLDSQFKVAAQLVGKCEQFHFLAFLCREGVVAGLSAAGITSGLAAIGGIIGGGMLAGIAGRAAHPYLALHGNLYQVQVAHPMFTMAERNRISNRNRNQ